MAPIRVAVIALILCATSLTASPQNAYSMPVSSALPLYPESAREARVGGEVKISFTVYRSGRIDQVDAISGNPLLREAAVAVVRSWRFEPELLRPKSRYETTFVYVLNVQSNPGKPILVVSMKDYRSVRIVSERYVKPIE